MITFDQREKDQADEKYAQIIFWAEIENVCYDHARELAASLQKYLAAKHSDVKLTVEDNRVSLSRGTRLLVISTSDHRTFKVARPGSNDIRDQRREIHGHNLEERLMMDEVLEWLALPAA